MYRLLPLLLGLGFITGCARYEYDLVHPADLRRHIGKTDAVMRLGAIEYKLRTVDNRLVMRAYNRSDVTMQLLGEESVAVAPDGESHPVRGRTIAPGSHVKLIFPPLRPRVYRGGPSFGVGVGVSARRSRYRATGAAYDPLVHEPAYLMVYESGEALYWDWKGESEARIILVYQRSGPAAATAPANDFVRHEFTFRRLRM